ncbi:MAG: M20/M25/M40 family metallo-hydrolase, partial [Acetobacteraceae bacterium]|nr:M20/M25/M40 family metallo-hydrolase [Acetobacteraceae bacterium]
TAARIIEVVDRIMRQEGETGRGTVGELHVEPNSRNVIPGKVRFSVEFRHPDTGELDRLDRLFQREVGAIPRSTGAALELKRLFTIPAQAFDPECVGLVREATRKLGLPARDIVSGAGHDAVYVARTVPTAMILIPCEGGLSHNEAENISPDDASNGCQTLFETVVMRANRPL